MNDIKIAAEVLHLSSAGKSVTRLLRAIVDKYGHQNIWVAGHSLGASLALEATRSLAIEGNIAIQTYLLNPPYLTAGRVARKLMQGTLNGVGDLGNGVLRAFGMGNTCDIRAGTDKVANICQEVTGKLTRMARRTAKSPYAARMASESQKLLEIGYAPYLFVNRRDSICNAFIKHFQRRHHENTSISSEVSQLVMPFAKSVHMIPSAVLYINNRGKACCEAHNNHQWFRYCHVELTVERQRCKFIGSSQVSPAPSEFF
jgi:hypothetical protein